MVDTLLITVGVVLSLLLAATAYAAIEYYRQLRRAQREYEKARDLVEDVIISFNRELKRESERLSNVDYESESANVKAETGLRKISVVEEKVLPLEAQVNNMSLEITKLTNLVGTIGEGSSKILDKISSLDSSEIDSTIKTIQTVQENISIVYTRVQEIEAKQESLRSKIDGIEEKIQKYSSPLGQGNDHIPEIQVLPIKREKALASLTDTEVAALEFLTSEGPKTAPEIKERVHLSREHTARLMKKLYEEGYLERETGKLPFRYSVKKEMEGLLKKPEPSTS